MPRYPTPRRHPREPDPDRSPLMSRRGQHPDLSPEGELRDDLDLPPAARDFNRRLADPTEREHFMAHVEAWQRGLPEDVQETIGGQQYGAGSTPFAGYRAYREHVDQLMSWGHARELTGADVARLSANDFDTLFDERGQLRAERRAEGWSFRPTEREISLTDGVDRYTRRELQGR